MIQMDNDRLTRFFNPDLSASNKTISVVDIQQQSEQNSGMLQPNYDYVNQDHQRLHLINPSGDTFSSRQQVINIFSEDESGEVSVK